MDLSNVLLRSLMLTVVTLILHVGASAAAAVSDVPPLPQNNDTTTVMTTGTTQTLGGTDDGDTATTLLPTNLTTEFGMTTEPSVKPGEMTTSTEEPGTTASKVMTTVATTVIPGKSGFRVGTFFCVVILLGCLIGIGFCGYQFYRKRQNDNYHTL